MGVSADTDTRWYRPIPDTGIVRTLVVILIFV